jgi:protein-tyrosine phosphatase
MVMMQSKKNGVKMRHNQFLPSFRRDNVVELKELYGRRTTVKVPDTGIMYHLIEMPDVTAPSLLCGNETYVLEEGTCFIDAALNAGSNVLVHCHKGEKRSPTVLLAWMGTRNYRLMDAIEKLDQEYRGKEGWGVVYRKTRKDWIEELKVWNRNWAERQKTWSEKVRITKGDAVSKK